MGTLIAIVFVLAAAAAAGLAVIYATGGQIHHGDKKIFGRGPDNGPLA